MSDVMTSTPIVLGPKTSVKQALHVADQRNQHHLLVGEEEGDIGVICLCDLLGRESLADALSRRAKEHDHERRRVAEFLHARTIAIAPTATIDQAAALMAGYSVGCLPVMQGGQLLGVVTRTDLRRAGVRGDVELDARCAACGTTTDVRHLPSMPGIGFCPSCWEESAQSNDERGTGD